MKKKIKEINWNEKENRQLLRALLSIETTDEAQRFLRDLMTEKEIREFANRLEAASLLSRDVQYNTITEDTGLSSTTVARISKWLKGPLGGYRLILTRLHHSNPKLRKGLSLSS
jgi:TrpR-related protein YerC/YecD